jgi:hypothetical protein
VKLQWEIEPSDIAKAFFEAHKQNPFVRNRFLRNVERTTHKLSKDYFWQKLVGCLLTTQQRSGPESAVTRFTMSKPYPLSYPNCLQSMALKGYVFRTITQFGGLRRGKTIARETESNLIWLEDDGWGEVSRLYEMVNRNHTPQVERQAAEIISNNMLGFGPKQSRNLLQDLGLTKYETPIDSRITKWLNEFGFPIHLSANALSDPNYYSLIEDGFQVLCNAIGTFPCLMDAAIFSSFDPPWQEDRLDI